MKRRLTLAILRLKLCPVFDQLIGRFGHIFGCGMV